MEPAGGVVRRTGSLARSTESDRTGIETAAPMNPEWPAGGTDRDIKRAALPTGSRVEATEPGDKVGIADRPTLLRSLRGEPHRADGAFAVGTGATNAGTAGATAAGLAAAGPGVEDGIIATLAVTGTVGTAAAPFTATASAGFAAH